jgi:hypothetical protein
MAGRTDRIASPGVSASKTSYRFAWGVAVRLVMALLTPRLALSRALIAYWGAPEEFLV